MKYIVRPLYIREAIVYDSLKTFRAVRWGDKKVAADEQGQTLGDLFADDALVCEDFEFPKLVYFNFYVCSNDLYDDYTNFKDFEEVDDFLHNNSSDWQDGGLYNAAHVVTLNEDNNIIEQQFYSVNTRSFVEMHINKKRGTIHLTKSHRMLMEQKKFAPEKLVFKYKEVEIYSF